MKNSQIRLVVVLGVIAILGIISVQVYWLRKAYDIKERQFNETIHTALLNVAENLANVNQGHLANENIVNQLASDYFVVNISDVIDANTLEYYLSNEFAKLQINLDFEYAIYDCRSDEMVYGNYVKMEEGKNKEEATQNLPTYDEYDYYFGVYLPTKASFVANNLRLSIFFSLILVVALVFFAYAMYVILQQKRLSELQEDFINNMTHEFKTPIASISLSSEVLQQNELVKQDLKLENYVKIIKEQAERLNRQVEKVLQIAKLQSNELELNMEELDLVPMLENVVRSTQLNCEKLGGKVTLETNLDTCLIKADSLHLNNILYNLLDNSLKYNDKKPLIGVGLFADEKTVLLSIQDNGIGIEQKYLKQLFNKFFRVPTGNIHNVKGFGLGLFYVKQVVDKHNWKIKVNSELQKGTLVELEIRKE